MVQHLPDPPRVAGIDAAGIRTDVQGEAKPLLGGRPFEHAQDRAGHEGDVHFPDFEVQVVSLQL